MSISGFLLNPATPHGAIEEVVRRRWRDVQHGEYELALALRRLYDDNVHRGSGRGRFVDYAAQRFDIPKKLVGLFCFLGRHLLRLPRTRAAMEDGSLTYTKIREFAAIATPENEETWIRFARTHTNRDVEKEAERARRGTNEDTRKIVSRLNPEELQAFRAVREKLVKALNEPVPAEQVLPRLAEMALESGLFDAGGLRKAPSSPAKPYLAIHLCPQCIHTWVPAPGENLQVPIDKWLDALAEGAPVEDFLSDLLCDCRDEKHRRDRCPHAKPTTGPPPKSRHIPASVRRRVAARDGFRCRTPGCGNFGPLESGHLTPHRDGTPQLPAFLCQQCATCNDLIEEGSLVVRGEAPFERYYEADGTFIGFGFDPDPHVGTSGDDGEDPETGPPEGRRKAA